MRHSFETQQSTASLEYRNRFKFYYIKQNLFIQINKRLLHFRLTLTQSSSIRVRWHQTIFNHFTSHSFEPAPSHLTVGANLRQILIENGMAWLRKLWCEPNRGVASFTQIISNEFCVNINSISLAVGYFVPMERATCLLWIECLQMPADVNTKKLFTDSLNSTEKTLTIHIFININIKHTRRFWNCFFFFIFSLRLVTHQLTQMPLSK